MFHSVWLTWNDVIWDLFVLYLICFGLFWVYVELPEWIEKAIKKIKELKAQWDLETKKERLHRQGKRLVK